MFYSRRMFDIFTVFLPFRVSIFILYFISVSRNTHVKVLLNKENAVHIVFCRQFDLESLHKMHVLIKFCLYLKCFSEHKNIDKILYKSIVQTLSFV